MTRSLTRRLRTLERRRELVAAQPDLRRRRRWRAVVDRCARLLHEALALMSTDEQERVAAAARQFMEGQGGPYSEWLRHLADGWCRLPELPAAAMKDLLLAWLSPEADGDMVCRGCGLEYPRHRTPPLSEWKVLPGKKPLVGPPPWYDLPELFAACPGCGGSPSDADWFWHIQHLQRPWMEFDGYVGLAVRTARMPKGVVGMPARTER